MNTIADQLKGVERALALAALMARALRDAGVAVFSSSVDPGAALRCMSDVLDAGAADLHAIADALPLQALHIEVGGRR